MSTQEDLSDSDAQQSLLTGLLALSTLLMVKQADWIWQSLYFQHYNAGELAIALVLMLASINIFVALIRHTLGQAISYKITNAGIPLLFSLILFNYSRQIELIPEYPTNLHKILALASGLAASLLTVKINPNVWKRLHLAAIAGGVIFTLLPFLLAKLLAPTIYWPSPSDQPATQRAPKLPAQNTIVLLLDEFSAAAADPVAAQLKDTGLYVTSISIEPAGKNTIDVIPAIWTRGNFDRSTACGASQVCSGRQVLDFSKVHASSENIDIVGFYHRYCSIQGLRSCSFAFGPRKNAITDLACSFPGVNRLTFVGCFNDPTRDSFISLQKNIIGAALKAPFWQKGGVLFAHLLAPHPLMGTPSKPLQQEYNDNIRSVAATVKIISLKARSKFGDNFRIIVFSDHPLRNEMWCSNKKYKELGCDLEKSHISSEVPLIIASPSFRNLRHRDINTNKAVFDLLFF